MINNDTTSKVTPVSIKEARKRTKDAETEKGGKKLFTTIKQTIDNIAKSTPALLTIGGGITAVTGVITGNPALARTGGAVMAIGYKALSNEKSNLTKQVALAAADKILSR